MKHTQKCWYNITDTTISKCYQNSEIISPFCSNGPVRPAKFHNISNINLGEDLIINHASQKDLDQDLGKLVFMKIVHQKDVMSISKLWTQAKIMLVVLRHGPRKRSFKKYNQTTIMYICLLLTLQKISSMRNRFLQCSQYKKCRLQITHRLSIPKYYTWRWDVIELWNEK